MTATLAFDLDVDGLTLARSIFSPSEVNDIRIDLSRALSRSDSEAVRRSAAGDVFAARNVLTLWPPAVNVWRKTVLVDLLRERLGARFGLVRGLYFDKPPDQTWSLPWHKDLTIAVRDNAIASDRFSKPTTKVGVPHVEAPVDVLERMLTLRIHLDPATLDNGALFVLPGSHRNGKSMESSDAGALPVLAEPGDVLAIRPLVSHCSRSSNEGTTLHRRILHLEFVADASPGDGFEWWQFYPGNG
ncbi:MAG: phytanoyl-CoA dioxygenase family protein [Gemmataceae bacterium]|nr:phytanoyl-CoA dioxygenase family protein [Gemmataceae bacterium]